MNIISILILFATALVTTAIFLPTQSPGIAAAILALGAILAASPRMINEWQRAVVLRLGRYKRELTPGISWLIPGLDQVAAKVDMRIRSSSFSAEKTLTRDTVPVNVDAVLFWIVNDAKKAVLEVEGFEATVNWVAQTTLRDVIGTAELVEMISERERLDETLRTIIDSKTTDWGITVQSVEIRDVRIPKDLEDAMSRKAQADREKEARIILAESELKVAEQMRLASDVYSEQPQAMRLRAMNMTYESVKEKGALMVIPSDMMSSVSDVAFGTAGTVFRTQTPEAT